MKWYPVNVSLHMSGTLLYVVSIFNTSANGKSLILIQLQNSPIKSFSFFFCTGFLYLISVKVSSSQELPFAVPLTYWLINDVELSIGPFLSLSFFDVPFLLYYLLRIFCLSMIFETVSLLDRSVHSFVFFIHSVVSLENKDGTMIICFFF